MSFLDKLKAGIQRLMTGRHGADEFSLALLIAGLALSIIGSLTRLGLLGLVSMALYVYAIFRMFSRDHQKRYAENQKYLSLFHGSSGSVRQFIVRMKNIRKYKYFKCPQCHSRLRLPRKVGEVTVTCGKCHHAFKQKA